MPRILDLDLPNNVSIIDALCMIEGLESPLAHLICSAAGIKKPFSTLAKDLTPYDIQLIERVVELEWNTEPHG